MGARAARLLAGLASPPACAACGAGCIDGGLICGGCERELRGARPLASTAIPSVDLALAAAEYAGCVRSIAHGLKFGRRLGLARVAAEAIDSAAPDAEIRGTVVPVPAAAMRWRWRGFDPAEEIALALAALRGLPYGPCLRRGSGPRQVGRPRSARVADPPRVRVSSRPPEEAVLIDDVWTTGATLGACADALRAAGATRVLALTLAHSR